MVSHALTARSLVAAGLLSFFTIGCGGGNKDFTPEDFKKITKGMSEKEVNDQLGTPVETMEAAGVRRSFWKSADKYYSISFDSGKVVEPLGPTTQEEDAL